MGERTHTPGPWAVKHTDTTYYVESAEGLRVVSTSWHGHIRKPYPLKAEAFANATLAAAAPDMFEALKAALPVLEAVQRQYAQLAKSHGMGGDGPVLEVVRAALAKASPHV